MSASPILEHFDYSHLPVGPLRQTSIPCFDLAQIMDSHLPDGPEKAEGLRKLLEAKDCFVRGAKLLLLPPEG